MKICFLTTTPFLIGGIQRVVITLANELCKENEVTIAYTFKPDNVNISYPLDDSIKLNYVTDFHDGPGKYKLQKVMRKIHENVIQIGNTNLLKNIYYPRSMQVSLIQYIKKNGFVQVNIVCS